MNSALHRIQAGDDLTQSEAKDIAIAMLNGDMDTSSIGAILSALHNKGESRDECLGFISAMRQHMTRIQFSQNCLMDICGTGGSLPNRFNASTCVALVLGSLGFYVAKHGNRGSKRANGSVDFLDALGIPYNLTPAEHQVRLNAYGSTFLFARQYHPAVRHAAEARKNVPHPTIFNLIGPFCNPASPHIQLIGAPSMTIANRILSVGLQLPYTTLAVITSAIGLDECSIVGTSTLMISRNGEVSTTVIDPEQLGIHATTSDITVSDHALAVDNATLFKRIIDEQLRDHPIALFIALNAAIMMHVANPSIPIQDGYHEARQAMLRISI